MLERFVAGLVFIGLLLWGASILATPSDPDLPSDTKDVETRGQVLPPLEKSVSERETAVADEEGDEDEDEEDDRDGKGKKGRDDG